LYVCCECAVSVREVGGGGAELLRSQLETALLSLRLLLPHPHHCGWALLVP
jgi:hypothetical protein